MGKHNETHTQQIKTDTNIEINTTRHTRTHKQTQHKQTKA